MAEPSKPSSSQESSGISKEEEANTSVTLDKMPVEILSHILSFIPERSSLRAAITSCSALHDAFKENKAHIASSVLFNSMDEAVYQELSVIYNLRKEAWKGAKAGAKAIHHAYNGERNIPKQDLTFHRVEKLWRIHKSVEYFAHRISTSLLRKHPVTKQKDHFAITPTVRSRFQRALYRLEAYLHIIRKLRSVPLYDYGGEMRSLTPEEQEEVHWVNDVMELEEYRVLLAFNNQYSVYESEQLSVICDLLVIEVAPCELPPDRREDTTDNSYLAFNYLLEHDIELGLRIKHYITGFGQQGHMNVIALGLSRLYKFMTCTSRAQQREVIQPVINRLNWNPTVGGTIKFPRTDEALITSIHKNLDVIDEWVNSKTPDYITRTPFFEDHDNGPLSAWSAIGLCNAFTRPAVHPVDLFRLQCRLRPVSWAYVFWDLKMLQASGFSNIDEDDRIKSGGFIIPQDHPVREDWNPLGRYETNHATEYLFLARCEKSQLKKQGRTGYFDYADFRERNKENLISNYTNIPPGVMMAMMDSLPTEADLANFMAMASHYFPDGGN
ncbi:hypothetical protein ACLX1H_010184 [Fusarium chlamydosporum]